ncbi:hypothetical protein ACIODS_12290 [Micromonospora chalcea]|uniref:hypothetical protein n=1 Tax=Micromonospora chalcea TaxID=1874 RepID=UPI003829DE12
MPRAAVNNLPTGGNWEGGYRTPDGREWVHVPWQGWREHRPASTTGDTMIEYEYSARLVDANGSTVDELTRPRSKPLAWGPGMAAAFLRSRGRDVTAVKLRRPAGSADEWEPYEDAAPAADHRETP